jgi:cytochrome P450
MVTLQWMQATTARAMDQKPPGPPPRTGTLDSLWYYYQFYRDSIGTVSRRFDRYGDIYYAPSSGVGLYVLRHPDHIWQVLVRDGTKYTKAHTAFERIKRFLGDGLLTTDGSKWRRQRRMVNPAFTKKRLAGYAEAMVSESLKCRDEWRPGEERDISREMMELTLRIVCRTLFDHDVGGQTDDVAIAMDAFRDHIGRPDLLPSWFPSPDRKRAMAAVDSLDEMIYGIIQERRQSGKTPDPPDLLHMLLSARDEEGDGGSLGDKEIRDQLVTLFLAGHETTSHAVTWTWYLLSQNPEAEAKMHAEIDEVLEGRAPTYADLENLTYVKQVFEESMRLYPPVTTTARLAAVDTEIGDYQVPAGSEVVIWSYMTHHDSRWFAQPSVFRPERFAPDQAAKRPKLSYMPFGAGARACVGKMFAMIEGQLILATLAQRYKFRVVPGHKVVPQPRVTLAPKYGMKMTLVERTQP